MNISKSKIKTYNNCPQLFKWQYIEKKRPEIPEAPITTIGKDIHNIFENFYDNLIIEKMSNNPFKYFKNSMKVLPQYQNIFDLFCKFQAHRWLLTENKDNFMPILKEKKFINNNEVGIVDVIHYDDKNYIILDYKSSASNPTNLRFELNFYKKLVDESKILDKPIQYIAVYGYRDGSFFCENINNKSYNIMLKKVESFKNIKFNEIEYPKKPGAYCSWCSYPKSCQKSINTIKDNR